MSARTVAATLAAAATLVAVPVTVAAGASASGHRDAKYATVLWAIDSHPGSCQVDVYRYTGADRAVTDHLIAVGHLTAPQHPAEPLVSAKVLGTQGWPQTLAAVTFTTTPELGIYTTCPSPTTTTGSTPSSSATTTTSTFPVPTTTAPTTPTPTPTGTTSPTTSPPTSTTTTSTSTAPAPSPSTRPTTPPVSGTLASSTRAVSTPFATSSGPSTSSNNTPAYVRKSRLTSSLPSTGSGDGWLIGAALALIVAGGIALRLGRKA